MRYMKVDAIEMFICNTDVSYLLECEIGSVAMLHLN